MLGAVGLAKLYTTGTKKQKEQFTNDFIKYAVSCIKVNPNKKANKK